MMGFGAYACLRKVNFKWSGGMEKGRVLLVDDNLDMLIIGQRIFSRAGYAFISARSGREGLQKAKVEKPDIIILDYILPDINGTQFIRTIATETEYADVKKIPIIILTARSEYIEDLQRCFELGLRAYLNKPFGHRELVNVVENIIRLAKVESRISESKPSLAAEAENRSGVAIDASWLDDVKLSASTIASLCRELVSEGHPSLAEPQKIELQAIYASSKRLLNLIQQKYAANAISN